jgi:hypothetical protein
VGDDLDLDLGLGLGMGGLGLGMGGLGLGMGGLGLGMVGRDLALGDACLTKFSLFILGKGRGGRMGLGDCLRGGERLGGKFLGDDRLGDLAFGLRVCLSLISDLGGE